MRWGDGEPTPYDVCVRAVAVLVLVLGAALVIYALAALVEGAY